MHVGVDGRFVKKELEVAPAHLPYLEAYIQHLTKAGHHVLCSLADFDDNGRERGVDFSSATAASYNHHMKAFKIDLGLVSKRIEHVWLEAALLAHEHDYEGKHEIDSFLSNITAAKWERRCRTHLPFDVEFSTPTVQLLCVREAILTFSLENIIQATRRRSECVSCLTNCTN